MVPDAQGDVENGKVVRCHRLHQRNDRKSFDDSEEHKRKFDIKNDIFKVEKNPTDDSKLVLTINRQPIGEWFKEQWEKLRQGLRQSAGEPRTHRGMKL